jgi:Transposase and inactivated derivatives
MLDIRHIDSYNEFKDITNEVFMTRIARGSLFADFNHFHILTEGMQGMEVFGANNMKNFYLATVEEKAHDMSVSVLAYCVMDNHSHLVVSSKDIVAVSEFMRRLNTTYAKFYNRLNGRNGYVFKGRYESDTLHDADEVLGAIYFVHNNPIKAKITVNSSEYMFSSAKDYRNQLSFIDYAELKRLFKRVPELSSFSHGDYSFKEARPSEDCDKVLLDLIKRFNITDMCALQDPELLKAVIYELQTRSGVSLRDVAVLVGLDREKIRRTAKKINYKL